MKTNKMKKTLFFALCYSISSLSMAVGVSHLTQIAVIDVHANGYFSVGPTIPLTGSPSCATVADLLTGNASSVGGKALLATAMLAYTQNKLVEMQGTGTCDDRGDAESLNRLILQ